MLYIVCILLIIQIYVYASDRIYKIQPLIKHFNSLFVQMAVSLVELWAIVEAMERHFSQHNLRNSFEGNHFDSDTNCGVHICSPELLLVKFNLYQGKYTGREGLSIGESVANILAMNFVHEGINGFNLFTTLHLLEKFRNAGKNLMGAKHEDRIRGQPISDIKFSSFLFLEVSPTWLADTVILLLAYQ